MFKYFAFALVLFSLRISFAQELVYSVFLDSTTTHKAYVGINLLKMGAKTVTYQMPIWAPGAYSVTHYGHYVSDFKAFDKFGRELPVKQVNGDRWEISNGKKIANISYKVSDSHKDSTSLYFALAHIDTNFFFANGTCLFGYVNDKKNIPSTVTYNFPKSWKLATALDTEIAFVRNPEDINTVTFKAKNYDELADAPVMAGVNSIFQTRSFQDGKATYDIVLASDRKFPMDSLEEYTHKIVHAETEFFHDTPFKHYTFLIYAPTYFNSPSAGQGALEHANSSDYLLINLPWKQFKTYGPQIIAHEFFHLWNVKRIHSSLLGPFDYTKRVMTTSLWLSEGITDYYSRTIMTRWNILPYKSFENMLTELQYAMNHSESGKTESLEQLSIDESDFDIGKATIFYSKGTLLGLLLDIEIRSRTNNKKSLDDVMFSLNAEAKKGKTFKDKELIGKMEKITGLDLQDFYHKYIAGTDSLPVDEYLMKMGVGDTANQSIPVIETESTSKTDTLSFSVVGTFLRDLIPTSNVESQKKRVEFTFYRVPSEGILHGGSIEVGDTLKMVNGEPFTLDKLIEIGKNFKRPVSFELEVAGTSSTNLEVKPDPLPAAGDVPGSGHRKHLELIYDVQRDTTPKHPVKYAPLPDATPLEVAIRHGIVGDRY